MSEFNIDELTLQSFKSFTGRHRIDLRSYGTGLHLVRGHNARAKRLGANGAGKSSLWDAINWCLFGRTAENLKNPDVRPWYGPNDPTQVTLAVQGVNGDIVPIHRQTDPNRLLLNEKDIGQAGVEEFIGMSYGVFSNTIMFGQDQDLFFDLGPSAKMALFSEVLNLSRWDARSGSASDEAIELQKKEAGIVGELRGIEAQQEQTTKLLDTAEDRMREWQEQWKELIATAEQRIAALAKDRDAMQKRHDQANLAWDGAETELKSLRKEREDLAERLSGSIAERRGRLAELEVLENQAVKLKADLKKLGETDKCPQCGQSIKGTNLASHKRELKNSIDQLGRKVKGGIPQQLDDDIRELENQLRIIDQEIKYHAESSEKAQTTFEFLTPKIAEAVAQIKAIRETKERQEEERNPHREQVETLRRQEKKLALDHKELSTDLADLSEEIARTKFWVKGFRDVRLYQIEETLAELEIATNGGLAEAGLIDWSVKYSIEKETKSGKTTPGLHVFVQSPDNPKPVKWESWSGGERQRLKLVGALSLSEVLLGRAGIVTGIEILDEPGKNLAEVGMEDLIDLLADRARQHKKQIWLTDHLAIESARFASVLTVVRDGKGSYLDGLAEPA